MDKKDVVADEILEQINILQKRVDYLVEILIDRSNVMDDFIDRIIEIQQTNENKGECS